MGMIQSTQIMIIVGTVIAVAYALVSKEVIYLYPVKSKRLT